VRRFGIVEVIGVVGTVLVVYRPGLSTIRHDAVLAAGRAIGVVERFASVGAGIKIGFAAPRIPFFVRVRPGWISVHAAASA
jgi:hypothetical protein